MIYEVSHRTLYRYTTPVVQSQHIVHMTPRSVPRQVVKGHTLLIDPAPTIRTERVDYYGNRAVMFDIGQEHEELIVHAQSTIAVTAPGPIDLESNTAWEKLADMVGRPETRLDLDVLKYTCASKHTRSTPELADFARASFVPGRATLQGAWELITRI